MLRMYCLVWFFREKEETKKKVFFSFLFQFFCLKQKYEREVLHWLKHTGCGKIRLQLLFYQKSVMAVWKERVVLEKVPFFLAVPAFVSLL